MKNFKSISLIASVAILSTSFLIGCGKDSNSDTSGSAVDGYIAGATIRDWNGSVIGHTDSNGKFSIVKNLDDANLSKRIIFISGGRDIDANASFEGIISAVANGSNTNVTPLTSLSAALIQANPSLTKEDADRQISNSLGITPEELNSDPIAMLDTNEARAREVLKKAIAVQKMVEVLAKAVPTDDNLSVMRVALSAVATASVAEDSNFSSVVNDLNSSDSVVISNMVNSLGSSDTLLRDRLLAATTPARNSVNIVENQFDNNDVNFTTISTNIEVLTSQNESNVTQIADANNSSEINEVSSHINEVSNSLVNDSSVSLDFNVSSVSLTAGHDMNLTLTISNDNNVVLSPITFASNNPGVALAHDNNGTVSIIGLSEGSATITATTTTEHGTIITTELSVIVEGSVPIPPMPISSLEFNVTSLTLNEGEEKNVTLNSENLPDASTITYSLTNPSVASVTENPNSNIVTIKGLRNGTTTIVAHSGDTVSNALSVNVNAVTPPNPPEPSDFTLTEIQDWSDVPSNVTVVNNSGRTGTVKVSNTNITEIGTPPSNGIAFTYGNQNGVLSSENGGDIYLYPNKGYEEGNITFAVIWDDNTFSTYTIHSGDLSN